MVPPEAGHKPGILLAMPFLAMGGGEAAVSQICRRLKGAGFRIFVITTEPVAESRGDTTEWFADSCCAIHHLPRSLPAHKWKGFIADLIAQNRIDVIWLAGSSFIYKYLPKLKRKFGRLAVVDLLFNPVGHTASNLKYASSIDHVVVEHSGMRDWLVEHGREAATISVIPNGIDLAQFARRPRRDWRTGQTLQEGAPFFTLGFLGRLAEEKGPDIFLDLAARFRDRPQVEFLICGAGDMESSMQRRIDDERLSGRVHMLGFRKTADILPCCDAVVVCSRLDGRPNILMESLSMGVPVVAWRVGGIPEMAPEGSGAMLADAGDVAGLEAAIVRLMERPEIRRDLSEAGFQFAQRHFSSEAAGAAYAGLFQGLIRAKPAGELAGGFLAGVRKLLGGHAK